MFERVIYKILNDAIEEITPAPGQSQATLRRLLSSPTAGWEVGGVDGENDEIQKIIDYWLGDGKPQVRVNYPRDAADLPCYAITLGSEQEGPEHYLNHEAGYYTPAAVQLVDEVEAELGRPVAASVRRFTLNYTIFVYTEHPDITLAYYTFLRNVMMSREARGLVECLEDPSFGGTDLMPSPQYLPTNVYTRQFTIQGYAHILYAEDLNLGPLGVARGSSVERIHVNDNVTGVNPGVDPYEAD